MFKPFILALFASLSAANIWNNVVDFNSFAVSENQELGYRLPNDTEPLAYDLQIGTFIHNEAVPEETRFFFNVRYRIHIRVLQETSRITMHAKELNFANVTIYKEIGDDPRQTWSPEEIKFDLKYDFVFLDLDEPLLPGEEYYIQTIVDSTLGFIDGFYRSPYVDENGKTQYLATTTLIPFARKMFPCYDELRYRADFDVRVEHGNSFNAISNTKVVSREPRGSSGYVITTFEKMPQMVTCLLAVVVSDLTLVGENSTLPQRIYGRKQIVESGELDYALRTGTRVIKQLDSYFGLNYTDLNMKLDQVAIPTFMYGGTGNLGLTMYKESALLYEPMRDSVLTKFEVAGLVAHELTHQYFANQVATESWGDMWLSEGFGTLYGHMNLVPIHPEFDAEDFFLFRMLHTVLGVDGFGGSSPLSVYIESPEEIMNHIGIIPYLKGGSVLRMWLNALGEETWRKGVNFYLLDMFRKVATPEDLGRNLQRAVEADNVDLNGLTMEQVVENWAYKSGYPVLHVALGDANELLINQTQFLYSGSPETSPTWYIPVSVASASEPSFDRPRAQLWMKEPSLSLTPNASKSLNWTQDDWILVNPRHTGYYRVNYETRLWDRLIAKLKSDSFADIHHQSRAQLLGDAFAFASSKHLTYPTVFRLWEYLRHERNFLPWLTVSSNLDFLDRSLTGTPAQDLFSRYVEQLVSPVFEHFGMRDFGNSESLGDKQARETAITWACRAGNTACQDETRKLVNDAVQGRKDIQVDLQNAIYCAGARNFETEEFLGLWTKMQAEPEGNVRERLIRSLGCNEIASNQKIFLESTLDPKSTYEGLEFFIVIYAVYTDSRTGLGTAIDFLTQNAKAAHEKYGALDQHASNMARLVSNRETFDKFKEMLAVFRRELIFTEEQERQLIAVAETNVDWYDTNGEEILNFLTEFFKSNDGSRPKLAFITLLMGAFFVSWSFLV